MFTGVVVESFSYVFQTSKGGAKAITREEMRAFKKIWSDLANPKTGRLEKSAFVPFFGVSTSSCFTFMRLILWQRLSGVFEVSIYPPQYKIPIIMDASRAGGPENDLSWPPPQIVDGIDLRKLSRILDTIDYSAIRRRRALYTRLYHEAIITHQGKGLGFTEALLLLAHHKFIVDKDALM
jgi:voltage-dependent calcium channel